MFKLKKLTLHNFMSFEDLDIEFARRGIQLIQGFNNKGGDSNGAGKSAILSGLTWTLFGKTQLGLQGKDVVRWGQDACTGILTLQSELSTYQIIRTSSTLEFYIDGQKQSGHKKDVQELINTTFGTDYDKFLTFSVFTKFWSKFITEVGDADRKKLFKNILRLDKIDDAYDKAKKIYGNLMLQANKLDGIITNIKDNIPKVETELATYEDYARNESASREAAIQDIENRKKLLEPPTLDFSEESTEITKRLEEGTKEKFNEKLEFLNIQLTNIRNLIYNDEQEIQKQAVKIKNFGATGGECPTCGQAIPPRHRTAYRRQLEVITQEFVNSYDANLKSKETIQAEIYELEGKINELIKLANRKKEMEMLAWENRVKWDKYNEFCVTAKDTIDKLTQTTVNYQKIIDDKRIDLASMKTSLETNQETFEAFKKEIDIFNYLIWLYSRQGVVSAIIEKCFNRLKFLANKFLIKLSTEGFKIDISPQKSLKSGELRDEIDIFVSDQDKKIPYQSLSAGQQQRINTAIMVALYMWGREIGCNNFDFVLLDEVLDLSIAAKGQEDILNLLWDLRPQIYHIFLITHKDSLTIKYDRLLRVVRDKDGISQITP